MGTYCVLPLEQTHSLAGIILESHLYRYVSIFFSSIKFDFGEMRDQPKHHSVDNYFSLLKDLWGKII